MSIDDLLAELRARLRHSPAVQGELGIVQWDSSGRSLPPRPPHPPLALDAVEAFEERQQLRLPPWFKRIYTEVANGGFGPHYGLNRLLSPANPDLEEPFITAMSIEGWRRWYFEKESILDEIPDYPVAALEWCELGCNITIHLDCSTEAGRLFRMDPHRGDGPRDWLVDLPETPVEWLWSWLRAEPWPLNRYEA